MKANDLFKGISIGLSAIGQILTEENASERKSDIPENDAQRAFRQKHYTDVSREEYFAELRGEKKADRTPQDQSINTNSCRYGFVYLIQNKDLYKIGITENLIRRFRQLKPTEILDVVRCSNYKELEQELHIKFKNARIPQTEYFRLTKEQVQQVHDAFAKQSHK